jgi:Glycosyl hydrolases family 16
MAIAIGGVSMTNWKRVFIDDFPQADDVDRSKWESPHWMPGNNPAYIPRTGFRNPTDFEGEIGLIPCTSENGADLRLSTYNPKAEPPGSAFLGSVIHTVEKWGGNGETLKFEARVKSPKMPGGAVTSVFSYALCSGPPEKPVQNEIDFEFASNHWEGPPPTQFLTNVFVCSRDAGSGPQYIHTGDDLKDWHIFSLIYSPATTNPSFDGSVEWLVDGASVRKEFNNIPDWKASGGMALYMNFWAPASDWGWAFNGSLNPVDTGPGDTWDYYVKNAAVYYGT